MHKLVGLTDQFSSYNKVTGHTTRLIKLFQVMIFTNNYNNNYFNNIVPIKVGENGDRTSE